MQLEAQIVALRATVDEAVVSYAVKVREPGAGAGLGWTWVVALTSRLVFSVFHGQSTLRGALEGAGREVAAAKNKQMMALVDVGIQKAKEVGASA